MTTRILLLFVALAASSAFASDPVVVTLSDKVTPPGGVVTLGHIAKLSGGSATTRQKMSALDLEDRGGVTVTKKQIAFRLKLAGFDGEDYVLVGSDRVVVGGSGGELSTDKVVAVAKSELARRLGKSADELFLDLVQPITVKLPETTDADDVEIAATPRGGTARMGRTQMEVTIRVNGKQKLAFAVHLNAAAMVTSDAGRPNSTPANSAATADAVLVRNKQQVRMTVRAGDLVIGVVGEANQDGKLGQQIKVTNVDSKKVVTGTVSGPGAVDVDPGGR